MIVSPFASGTGWSGVIVGASGVACSMAMGRTLSPVRKNVPSGRILRILKVADSYAGSGLAAAAPSGG